MASKPSAQPKPAQPKPFTVDHDVPLPEHKVMPGNKYGDLFAKPKPKSSVGCVQYALPFLSLSSSVALSR